MTEVFRSKPGRRRLANAVLVCLLSGALAQSVKPAPVTAQDGEAPYSEPRRGDEENRLTEPQDGTEGSERRQADPELIDPGPDGCPFDDEELQLLV